MARRVNQRMRRGVTGTAVAAVAMAALTASQAPGVLSRASDRAEQDIPATGPSISGDTSYYTDLPPLGKRGRPGTPSDRAPSVRVTTGAGAIPSTVLAAYRKAEEELGRSNPGCNLSWELLAAIGQVESGQARGGRVDADGTTLAPILGPQLNGNGFASISDTDNGAYDDDTAYDRAVGPMQFIPSTWATWGADGNGDGEEDPHNIYDAALAAGRYLCAGGRDLSDPYDLDRAILGYNHSEQYLRTVKAWFAYFRDGHVEVPDHTSSGSREPRSSRPTARPKPSSSAEPERSSRPTPSAGTSPSARPSPSHSRPNEEPEADEPDSVIPDTDDVLPGIPKPSLPGTGRGGPLGGDTADQSENGDLLTP
ncbi:lytic murein transglycosylase [Streptomyces sp. KR80]|uniref:lytic murein transglycosylase n=1 Tax=Streptomyces sp. KR80 TaxID=3457426 RepID=UPI003FD26584